MIEAEKGYEDAVLLALKMKEGRTMSQEMWLKDLKEISLLESFQRECGPANIFTSTQ